MLLAATTSPYFWSVGAAARSWIRLDPAWIPGSAIFILSCVVQIGDGDEVSFHYSIVGPLSALTPLVDCWWRRPVYENFPLQQLQRFHFGWLFIDLKYFKPKKTGNSGPVAVFEYFLLFFKCMCNGPPRKMQILSLSAMGMLNHSWVSVKRTYTPRQWFNTLIPRSRTVASVAYTVFIFGHAWLHPWSYQPFQTQR